jgi:hypothetical protein
MNQAQYEYEVMRQLHEIERDPAHVKWLAYYETKTRKEQDMKINEMKESKYVKKEEAGNGIVVTIAKVTQENVAMQNQPEELKYILHFQEDIKPLVMNWTNIQLCAQATGTDETDEWAGKQIVLFNDPNVSFGGQITGGVRIRSAQQSAPTPAKQDFDERNPPPSDDASF